MYAIAFDLDLETLKLTYHNDSFNNAYNDIARFLQTKGFDRVQGSVYFGNDKVDAVKTVMAVNQLSKQFSWFGSSVRDIRMLRIEENNDLRPAIEL